MAQGRQCFKTGLLGVPLPFRHTRPDKLTGELTSRFEREGGTVSAESSGAGFRCLVGCVGGQPGCDLFDAFPAALDGGNGGIIRDIDAHIHQRPINSGTGRSGQDLTTNTSGNCVHQADDRSLGRRLTEQAEGVFLEELCDSWRVGRVDAGFRQGVKGDSLALDSGITGRCTGKGTAGYTKWSCW